MATLICQPVPKTLTDSFMRNAVFRHSLELHSTTADHWLHRITPTVLTGGLSWSHQSQTWVLPGFPLVSGFLPSHCVALRKESLCRSKQWEVTLFFAGRLHNSMRGCLHQSFRIFFHGRLFYSHLFLPLFCVFIKRK